MFCDFFKPETFVTLIGTVKSDLEKYLILL